MIHKVLKVMLVSALLVFTGSADARFVSYGNEWKDMQVNEINRFPIHTDFFTYESMEKALAGNRTASANYVSLNGMWKYSYVGNADARLTDKAFSASALRYSVSEMDEGVKCINRHPEQIHKSRYANLYIDAEALPQYRVEYKDRVFRFSLVPQSQRPVTEVIH